MPKVKIVNSLFTLSINCVKSNLENINNVKRSKPWSGSPWFIQQTTNAHNSESDINRYFQEIPTVLLEVIINSLSYSSDAKTLKFFNLKFLITSELKKIIFPCLFYKYDEYLNCFPKLEKLQVLVLRNSNVDNNCLKMIGTWCKNLRVLDVRDCCELTDTGIEWLVRKSTELSKTLQELLISCPAVTKKGIKMAVQHLSALQNVGHSAIFEVLVDVIQSAAPVQHLPQSLNISFVRLFICPGKNKLYRRGNFGLVIQFCPLLFDVTISVKKGLTDTDLLCLTNLKKLLILRIMRHSSSKGNEITFDMGFAPVLKVIGSSLKVLDLAYFNVVDIWTIVKYCPNLISLNFANHSQRLNALSENEMIGLGNVKGRAIFEDLKVLRCGYNLSKGILFDFLSCPLLENVVISHCDAFTDDVLKEALANGILENLKELSLHCCDLVTRQGLDLLIINENSHLNRISFRNCEEILHSDVYDWHTFARNNNWKLHLTIEMYGTEPVTYN